MQWIAGGVTAARGFTASGLSAGIKVSRRPDVALVAADRPVTAAAVFTTNRVQAAPVHLSRARLQQGRARAVLLNSGCANCMTGAAGLRDARTLSRAVAKSLRSPEEQILVASTGLIGTRLPVRRVLAAVPELVRQLSRARHLEAATAILTTDRLPKEAAVEATVGGRTIRLGGMAKGAGMIAPCMATMLCVLTTDAAMPAGLLREVLREASAQTFNRLSIDGDMSTNDTVFGLASGRAGVTITAGERARLFGRMALEVTRKLALAMAQDGEGVTRVAEIRVSGARTDSEAQRCARQVATSSLVKTMLAGGDPNVGRLAAAAGASGAGFDPDRLEIRIGTRRVVKRGTVVRLQPKLARRLLARRRVRIELDLHAGRGSGWMLTTDLTEAYVRINARYVT